MRRVLHALAVASLLGALCRGRTASIAVACMQRAGIRQLWWLGAGSGPEFSPRRNRQ
jgi:hypothetical protein